MKFLLLSLFLLVACQQEKNSTSLPISKAAVSKVAIGDDFSDLKKEDDESCDTEEDLKKKLEADIEKQKKGEAVQLQGGDPDCAVQ